MGAGRGGRRLACRLGLRLPAGHADWARQRATPLVAGSGRGEILGLSALFLVLVAQAVETPLHLLHLALEIVDLDAAAAAACFAAGRRLVRLGRRLSLPPRERREHGESALEHLHVPPHLILERAERAAAERLRHL